jgi:hypothetical protein
MRLHYSKYTTISACKRWRKRRMKDTCLLTTHNSRFRVRRIDSPWPSSSFSKVGLLKLGLTQAHMALYSNGEKGELVSQILE